ncbi:MAG: hypothetical protein ACYC3F_01085 [Gemmatimonadaceae bacterium]
MRNAPTPAQPQALNSVRGAIANARAGQNEMVELYQELDDPTIGDMRSTPVAMGWGCGLTAYVVDSTDRWPTDIVAAPDGPDGLVHPFEPMLPEGGRLLLLVTESGSAVPLTPAIAKALEAGNARILGSTPIYLDVADDGVLGDDDPLTSIDVTLVPTPIRPTQPAGVPTTMRVTISASACPSPVVILCPHRPAGLPR